MMTSSQARVSVVLLAASLLLNFILVSCAAETTAPPPPADNTEVLAKLEAVMTRLAAIEAKFEPQTTAINNRIDSIGRVLLAAHTVGDTTVVSVGQGQIAKLDSIMALASYLANEEATGGAEACIGLSAKGELKIGPKADAEGEGAADGGAWAGTGAYAGAKVKVGLKAEFEGSVELPIGIEYCTPVGGETPPVRSAPGSKSAGATASQRTALVNAATQLGITETRVMSSMTTLTTAFQSPTTMRLQDVGAILPLPGGVASFISNPMGALTGTIPARIDDAVTNLCNVNWGSRVATPIATACARINGGLPDIGGMFSMLEQFPAVQTTLTTVNTGLTNVTNRLSTVCGRVNTFGNTSLTIPNPLSIGPDPLFGPSRLFPGFTSISC